MKIFLASDHAGLDLKTRLISHFRSHSGLQLVDLGPSSAESVDYPDFADLVTQKLLETKDAVAEDPTQIGILICGSGQGMAMRANRRKGIRAALCWNAEVAGLAREHNNANVLCLAGRLLNVDLCVQIVERFLSQKFAKGRHIARVEKLDHLSDHLV